MADVAKRKAARISAAGAKSHPPSGPGGAARAVAARTIGGAAGGTRPVLPELKSLDEAWAEKPDYKVRVHVTAVMGAMHVRTHAHEHARARVHARTHARTHKMAQMLGTMHNENGDKCERALRTWIVRVSRA
jgi:hypothetical protein